MCTDEPACGDCTLNFILHISKQNIWHKISFACLFSLSLFSLFIPSHPLTHLFPSASFPLPPSSTSPSAGARVGALLCSLSEDENSIPEREVSGKKVSSASPHLYQVTILVTVEFKAVFWVKNPSAEIQLCRVWKRPSCLSPLPMPPVWLCCPPLDGTLWLPCSHTSFLSHFN